MKLSSFFVRLLFHRQTDDAFVDGDINYVKKEMLLIQQSFEWMVRSFEFVFSKEKKKEKKKKSNWCQVVVVDALKYSKFHVEYFMLWSRHYNFCAIWLQSQVVHHTLSSQQ